MSDERYHIMRMNGMSPAGFPMPERETQSSLAAPAGSASRMFFFGCLGEAGHYLHDNTGRKIWTRQEERAIPFRWEILDGGLMPQDQHPVQGKIHYSIINGWTIISMGDYTVDTRPGSNCSFLVEGVWTLEQMVDICSKNFAAVWQRVKPNK